ncbi:metal ABC transporter substrate-binding protein [Halopiger xanaduensis]|uniref:ABC-type metal ion transporter, periplasmic subunit n=1 Tax=Halopiger xanaduensis (strain DSM 18323 / JCM 14033 / SH-6) TaxID=797210 RepID=F8D7B5_HALXS|nr:zinc ABC transporter substrate-binding protein [Halopiger xanaduensis]AEH37832.1 ABC-type metal ion transporter, periplasmic subunit [Halopiger xanaduensis SH-6]
MNLSRRSVLHAGAGSLALSSLAGLAGCLSEPDADTGPEGGYAAFFALQDWSEHVAGDQLSFENPVEAGQIGHGWEPQGDLTADIADSEVFVYLDSPEFAWAQDVASQLETDYDHVTLIDGMDGIEDELLAFDEAHDHDHGSEDDHDHEGDHAHEDEEEHDHETNDSTESHDEHEGHDDHADHEDEHDHDHNHEDETDDAEFHDPHVWVDPVLAQDVVGTIADGLAEADPDNEDTYRENADAYAQRLADVDDQLESLVAEADRDVAVLAGHDSFRYIEERYGFELHTPVDVSPNAEVTAGQLADTIDLIDEHEIETILYDPFETTDGDELPQQVTHLLENSYAESAEPISPLAGTTAEWNDRGWGWLEQMTELNLPALRAALGVGE